MRANHYGTKLAIAASIPPTYALIQELTEEELHEYQTYWQYKVIIATIKRQRTGEIK